MIQLSDLKHRDYAGKDCIGFQYNLKLEECPDITFDFRRVLLSDGTITNNWRMSVGYTNYEDVGNFRTFLFEVPKNYYLELVCGHGLMLFKEYVLKCLDYYQTLNYSLLDVLRGML